MAVSAACLPPACSPAPTSTSRSSTSGTTLFQPLLYQVATGILSPGEISPVLRHTLRRKKNVRVVLSKVTGFDLERRVVHTASLPGETERIRL